MLKVTYLAPTQRAEEANSIGSGPLRHGDQCCSNLAEDVVGDPPDHLALPGMPRQPLSEQRVIVSSPLATFDSWQASD